jgi:two-component system chemotaxis response regulator CheB
VHKIRVLIVDDSAYSRQAIRKMLDTDPDIEVAGISSDGVDAMTKTIKLRPDLITLDLEMPKMDGFSFLRWLMKKRPTPVMIVSSYSDSKTVFKALELGAVDFVVKPPRMPSKEFHKIEKDLLDKVRGIKKLRLDKLSKNLEILEGESSQQAPLVNSGRNIEVVAIGASTGGPAALKIILTRLPSDFPAGIVVSQHMPKGFTDSFAERLNNISKVHVKEAKDGDEVVRGRVLICPGGFHMLFKKGRRIVTAIKEPKNTDKYIPSVDMMMSSAAEVFGPTTMGIVLTGMGSDGIEGMLKIKTAGGYTIAESEDSAVVFGMPSEVIKAGAAEKVLPISEIPTEIIRLIRKINQKED